MDETAESQPVERPQRVFFRRNLFVNSVVDMGFGFGLGLVAVGPIITIFFKSLGASNVIIGLAPALFMASYGSLQLLGAYYTHRLRVKKRVFVAMHIVAWSLWVPIGLVTLALGRDHPRATITALLAISSVSYAIWGAAATLWAQLMPRLFPPERRGISIGVIIAANTGASALGGLLAAHVLARYPSPLSYAILFITAGVIICLMRSLHLLVVEAVPTTEQEAPEPPLREALSHLARDRRFRRLIGVRYLYEAGATVGAFFAVYTVTKLELPNSAGGLLAMAMATGSALGSPLLGQLGDRRGNRRVMGWGWVLYMLATLFAVQIDRPGQVWPLFFVLGLSAAGDGVAIFNLLVEMSTEQTRGYYLGAFTTAMVPVRLLGPLTWGWLSQRMPFEVCFLIGLGLQLVAWLALVALVDDPRRPGQRILRRRPGTILPRFY